MLTTTKNNFILDKLDLAANKKNEKAKKDESKRMKTNPNRLYPVLSDIESTTPTESDVDNNCTTATLSDDDDDFTEKAPLQRTTQKQYYHNQDPDDRWDKIFDCFLFCFCIE